MVRKEFFRVPVVHRRYLRLSARSRGLQVLVFGEGLAKVL